VKKRRTENQHDFDLPTHQNVPTRGNRETRTDPAKKEETTEYTETAEKGRKALMNAGQGQRSTSR